MPLSALSCVDPNKCFLPATDSRQKPIFSQTLFERRMTAVLLDDDAGSDTAFTTQRVSQEQLETLQKAHAVYQTLLQLNRDELQAKNQAAFAKQKEFDDRRMVLIEQIHQLIPCFPKEVFEACMDSGYYSSLLKIHFLKNPDFSFALDQASYPNTKQEGRVEVLNILEIATFLSAQTHLIDWVCKIDESRVLQGKPSFLLRKNGDGQTFLDKLVYQTASMTEDEKMMDVALHRLLNHATKLKLLPFAKPAVSSQPLKQPVSGSINATHEVAASQPLAPTLLKPKHEPNPINSSKPKIKTEEPKKVSFSRSIYNAFLYFITCKWVSDFIKMFKV